MSVVFVPDLLGPRTDLDSFCHSLGLNPTSVEIFLRLSKRNLTVKEGKRKVNSFVFGILKFGKSLSNLDTSHIPLSVEGKLETKTCTH